MMWIHPKSEIKLGASLQHLWNTYEKRFKEEMERVNGWRIALKEVADLGGMVLGDG
jgi:hypothetical protein